MLPLLRIVADGREHQLSALVEVLADEFKLTPEERAELVPSGGSTRFYIRVYYARFYMTHAALLESPRRGRYRITQRGHEVLADHPGQIDEAYLRQFPEFREFRRRSGKRSGQQPQQASTPESDAPDDAQDAPAGSNTPDEVPEAVAESDTPDEALEDIFERIRAQLIQELRQQMKQTSPRRFETLVVDLLLAMGYGGSRRDAGEVVGKSGDGGIDGIIKEDRLGLDVIYIQAKRWDGTVGSRVVREFSGSLDMHGARKGVLITTSGFSPDAKESAERSDKQIILIDGRQLAELMIDHNVGVSEVQSYVVKRVDEAYFEEE